MKIIYLALFMVCTVALSGQEVVVDLHPQKTDKAANFTLYPNPAFDDVVYITTKNNAIKEIMVYDVFGEVVLKDRISSNTLNISRLIPGIYVLQVTENNTSMTRKLVVK